MDKLLRAEIVNTVNKTIQEMMEMYGERWLTGEQLIEQFGMFTKGWLKAYGYTLPRTQAVVTDENGEQHRTSWVYPMHKINHMIQDGRIKNLDITNGLNT